jgi:hypothetical protein
MQSQIVQLFQLQEFNQGKDQWSHTEFESGSMSDFLAQPHGGQFLSKKMSSEEKAC